MKLIHTSHRIAGPERSIAFYEALGFEKRRELSIRQECRELLRRTPSDVADVYEELALGALERRPQAG